MVKKPQRVCRQQPYESANNNTNKMRIIQNLGHQNIKADVKTSAFFQGKLQKKSTLEKLRQTQTLTNGRAKHLQTCYGCKNLLTVAFILYATPLQ